MWSPPLLSISFHKCQEVDPNSVHRSLQQLDFFLTFIISLTLISLKGRNVCNPPLNVICSAWYKHELLYGEIAVKEDMVLWYPLLLHKASIYRVSTVEMLHCLSFLKEFSSPHLSFHRSTANVVGFLVHIPAANESTCPGSQSVLRKNFILSPFLTPVQVRSYSQNIGSWWVSPPVCFRMSFHLGKSFLWDPSIARSSLCRRTGWKGYLCSLLICTALAASSLGSLA